MNKTKEDEFDLEKYRDNILKSMEDREDKNLFLELTNGVLFPFTEYITDQIQQLTQKLQNELNSQKADYTVDTALVKREFFDEPTTNLYPMVKEDLLERKNIIVEQEPIGAVYINANHSLIQELFHTKRIFRGCITTSEDTYEFTFSFKQRTIYQEKVEMLYNVFVQNGIPWCTICAPFLNKFYDLYLENTNYEYEEEIVSIKFDFEELEPYIEWDRVPVWNITECQQKSSIYPEPALDRLHFRHTIYRQRLHDDRDYLVANHDVNIIQMERENYDLHIDTDTDIPVTWNLLAFQQRQENGSDLIIYSNRRNYIRVPENHVITSRIVTKGEMIHFIQSLGYEQYVALQDIKYIHGEVAQGNSYCVDAFLEDELLLPNNPNHLIVEFIPADVNDILNEDILSYIITRMQWEYPQYHVIGCIGTYRE